MSDSYWVEDEDNDRDVTIPDDIMDINFKLSGTHIPIDHAWELSQNIQAYLPWISDEPEAAIHQIHVAASGNGWYRPEDNEHEVLHLSKRTHLTLRIPKHRLPETQRLSGQKIEIGGNEITLGASKTRPLSKMTTLFSRYVAGPENETEFMAFIARQLRTQDIKFKKLLCGKTHAFKTPDGNVFTRSIMMAELDLRESIALQRSGIGPHRLLGCGIVIPHKGIEAVKKMDSD